MKTHCDFNAISIFNIVRFSISTALLQHGANPTIRNSEQKTPLDLADDNTRPVLTGEYRKDELLEAARSGNEDLLLGLLTPLNVNCHASDGRRSTPLHLAAGYNRIHIVQILLQNGADVHAKDKGVLCTAFLLIDEKTMVGHRGSNSKVS